MSSIIAAPKLLSVMLTYQCPAQCADCGTFSGPNVRTALDVDKAKLAIRQAPEAGFEGVVFTGGEATIRWNQLLECLSVATECGLRTRLVSNGYWAKNSRVTFQRVEELRNHGLQELNLSTGDQHVRFVSVDLVADAAVKAAAAGLLVVIVIEVHKERVITAESLRQHEILAGMPSDVASRISITESPWMPVDPSSPVEYPEGVAVTSTNLGMRTGCSSVLTSYTLQADGSLTACCGLGVRTTPELRLSDGDTIDLASSIREGESDIIKLLVHYIGPEKLVAWAASHDPKIEWEGMYAHTCHACMRLYHDDRVRSVVRQHHEELIPNLVAAIAIDEALVPQSLGSR